MAVAGVYDHQDKSDLELASARNLWRVRANRLLEGIQKPTMQQIQRHIKEVCVSGINWVTGTLYFFFLLIMELMSEDYNGIIMRFL